MKNLLNLTQESVLLSLPYLNQLTIGGSLSLRLYGVVDRPVGDLDLVTTDKEVFEFYVDKVKKLILEDKVATVQQLQSVVKTEMQKEEIVATIQAAMKRIGVDAEFQAMFDSLPETVEINDAPLKHLTEDEISDSASVSGEGVKQFYSEKGRNVKFTENGVGVCIFFMDENHAEEMDITFTDGRTRTFLVDNPYYAVQAKWEYIDYYHQKDVESEEIHTPQLKRWKKHSDDVIAYFRWFEQNNFKKDGLPF